MYHAIHFNGRLWKISAVRVNIAVRAGSGKPGMQSFECYVYSVQFLGFAICRVTTNLCTGHLWIQFWTLGTVLDFDS